MTPKTTAFTLAAMSLGFRRLGPGAVLVFAPLLACGSNAPEAESDGASGAAAGNGGASAGAAAGGNAGLAAAGGRTSDTGGAGLSPQGGSAGEIATGATAGSGGAMLALKQPLQRGSKFVFEFGSTYLEVDPEIGGRVSALRYADRELLSGPAVSATNYGSTFWPSPQSAWGWPPPAELDSGPYAAELGATSVDLVSEVNAATSLKVGKRYTANLLREAVDVEYTLTNVGAAIASWAPWEITRVPADGLTFWKTGGTPFKGGNNVLLVSEQAAGHTWVKAEATPGEAKVFADGAGGFIAYVRGDLVLIKQFEDQPANAAAPAEAEIEIYVDPLHSYVEVEQQGAYAPLLPGASSTWKVRWYARRLPPGLVSSVGSAELVAFVARTLQ